MVENQESSDEKEEVVVDTPVRSKTTQIRVPTPKFEESPVFNFLNNLSPIQQIKSVHISQTINSLNFTSIPSIFTSPHVSTLKESRFLRRHQLGDPSRPEFSSEDVSKYDKTKGKTENSSPGDRIEVSDEPHYECSPSLNYNFGSPNINQITLCGLRTRFESETDASSRALVPYGQEGRDNMFHGTDQIKEGSECEWDSSISDTADLLNFDSPNDAEASKITSNDIESSQVLVGPSGQLCEGNDPEDQFAQPGGESEPNINRGMRRRCLVFDLSGARKKNLPENSNSNSPKQTVPAKFGNPSSRCVLPGIGLHLNALAATSKDYKVVRNESCTSGKQLVITPLSANHHRPLNSSRDSLSKAVDVTQSDRHIVLFENGRSMQEDGVNVSDYMVNDELNQTSPKKKRRRSESGEGESCKRCNCKKSKCLKLYCECFAAGLYCVEPCSCIDCFNTPSHEDTVLATRKQIESRNPLAFAPKVIRTSDRLSEAPDDSSKTPASARHKRGCNCKKSGCLKKYCECYQSGVGCSINCRCEGCKNAFGRKDGPETELEEVDATRKILIDGSRESLDYVNPATPVPFGRPMHHLPFSSTNRPSSSLCLSQAFTRPDNFGVLEEEDIPAVLQTNGSPTSGVKSLSPNGKRISSPHTTCDTSSRQRSSRKLVLKSIPFPSLTPKNGGGVVSSSEEEIVSFVELQ